MSIICRPRPLGSPPSPEKESVVAAVTTNSIVAAVPQLQNSDAFAAVAQLFQSSQGQQVGGGVGAPGTSVCSSLTGGLFDMMESPR